MDGEQGGGSDQLLYAGEVFRIQGAIFDVYRTMGPGFLEAVYQECLAIELKAVRELAPEHRSQVLNYLRATGLRLGLLVNFGAAPKVKVERFAL